MDLYSVPAEGFGDPTYPQVFFATDETLTTKSNVLLRWLRAEIKGWTWMANNPEETARIVVAKYGRAGLDLDQQIAEAKLYKSYILGDAGSRVMWIDGALFESAKRLISFLIEESPQYAATISFQRETPNEKSPELLSSEPIRKFKEGIQHAVGLRRRRAIEGFEATERAFESFDEAVCLVDADGRILRRSVSVASFLDRQNGLRIRDDRFWHPTPALTAMISNSFSRPAPSSQVKRIIIRCQRRPPLRHGDCLGELPTAAGPAAAFLCAVRMPSIRTILFSGGPLRRLRSHRSGRAGALRLAGWQCAFRDCASAPSIRPYGPLAGLKFA